MNLNVAATAVAVSALIGYFLMRFLLPTLHYERLVFMGSLALISVFLMFIYRKQTQKKQQSNDLKQASKQTNAHQAKRSKNY
jgi:mannose/fructose/N-acetylgalactosamine-specific phosphotransferase system component IIC